MHLSSSWLLLWGTLNLIFYEIESKHVQKDIFKEVDKEMLESFQNRIEMSINGKPKDELQYFDLINFDDYGEDVVDVENYIGESKRDLEIQKSTNDNDGFQNRAGGSEVNEEKRKVIIPKTYNSWRHAKRNARNKHGDIFDVFGARRDGSIKKRLNDYNDILLLSISKRHRKYSEFYNLHGFRVR